MINVGHVYFVTDGKAIKIGFSENPERRLSGLQTGHHSPLRMLGSVPASVVNELEVHRRFRHLHIRGEWFRPAPELKAFIERMREAKEIVMEVTVADLRSVRADLRKWGDKQSDATLSNHARLIVRNLRRLERDPGDQALLIQTAKNIAAFERYANQNV